MVVRRPRRLALCGLAAAALVGAGLPASAVGGASAPVTLPRSAEPVPGPAGILDDEAMMSDVDCESAQLTGPAATSTAALTGTAKQIRLDALVLVDVAAGAKIAAIRDARKRAAAERALYAGVKKRIAVSTQSYAPLDITLAYDRFALLQPLVKGKPRTRTDNAQEIIALAKAQYRGVRPKGVDVVYVVTDLDIQVPGLGNAVAGLADCIGGVALPGRAFAVGELSGDRGVDVVPGAITLDKELTAKIAGHEIGHLMGGQHHYQECGTAAPAAVARGEAGPCTLMTNAVNFLTLPFSTLNGIVVRGHAEKYAAANG